MTPIAHAITRHHQARPLLGPLYSGECTCGTPFPPTVDRDGREEAIRGHLLRVAEQERRWAEAAQFRRERNEQQRRYRARKETA